MATHMDVVNVQLTAANTRMNSNAKRPLTSSSVVPDHAHNAPPALQNPILLVGRKTRRESTRNAYEMIRFQIERGWKY